MTTIEFSAARASVAQAVKQAEQARALRIESIDRQLPALEADITTKQQEVAALRAERERLQAQTGAQIVAGMVGDAAEQKRAPVFGPEDHERCHYCKGLFLKPVEYHHSEQECAFLTSQIEMGAVSVKRLADAAEKKESGPLKFGDRVEVLEGVRDLVHASAISPGQYEVTRIWGDGAIRIQRGRVQYMVNDFDVRRV